MIYSNLKISGLTIKPDEVNESKILAHSFGFIYILSKSIHFLYFNVRSVFYATCFSVTLENLAKKRGKKI